MIQVLIIEIVALSSKCHHGASLLLIVLTYLFQPLNHDASLSQVLQHIQTLDVHNVFRDYEAYIVAIQAGFIGAWGELYSSV